MAWKVANYNALRQEADGLRTRYQNLQRVVNQTNEQLATLQLFANEVSVAYRMTQKLEGPPDISVEARLVPTMSETVAEYNYLRNSNISRFQQPYARRWHANVQPSIWPVNGRLTGAYGQRTNPFNGEGSYHTGVDLSAPTGTIVRATGDGVVTHARQSGAYGRLVVIEHGRLQTWYAHLSRVNVIEGQEIRRGEILGAVGTSGRVTAPHLHYEVRVGKAPVNPYRFLAKAGISQMPKADLPF